MVNFEIDDAKHRLFNRLCIADNFLICKCVKCSIITEEKNTYYKDLRTNTPHSKKKVFHGTFKKRFRRCLKPPNVCKVPKTWLLKTTKS